MGVIYSVTPELRAKFKEPFGLLVRGTFSETMHALNAIFAEEKPPVLVAVGDTVSRNIHTRGLPTRLLITDSMRKRRRVASAVFPVNRVVHVSNPAGVITEESVVAVREALEGKEQVHLVVDGEEDLLVLIAVLYAPLGGLVVYGQPGEGVVVVRVTPEKRAEAAEFLKAMEVVPKVK